MLALILVIVVGTIRLVGSNANMVFSQAASSIQLTDAPLTSVAKDVVH
jgi:hypothetical protein